MWRRTRTLNGEVERFAYRHLSPFHVGFFAFMTGVLLGAQAVFGHVDLTQAVILSAVFSIAHAASTFWRGRRSHVDETDSDALIRERHRLERR